MNQPAPASRPKVIADGPLAQAVMDAMGDQLELLPWQIAIDGSSEPVGGIYTYDRPLVDGAMLDRLPGAKIISNYGVGVDHIRVSDAAGAGHSGGQHPGNPRRS